MEIGQVCEHPLERVGRHRVCRECTQVYFAIAGPNEVGLLGQYAAIRALLDEHNTLAATLDGGLEGLRNALESAHTELVKCARFFEQSGGMSEVTSIRRALAMIEAALSAGRNRCGPASPRT